MKYTIDVLEKESFDCIVCGGGISGITAAISAARFGLSVAIIEQMGCFGGTATNSRVCQMLGGRKYQEQTGKMDRKIGGLFDEMTDRLISRGEGIDPDTIDVNWNPYGWYPRMAAGIPIDGEKFKCLLDDMIVEEKVRPYLFTRVVETLVNNEAITSILLHNKSGFFSLKSKYFIDATGDADVAVLSGCSTVKGREKDGLMTPATLIFHADNVDGDALVAYQNANNSPKLVEIIDELRTKGIWDFPFDIFITVQLNDKDVFMVNTLRQVGIDGTDGDSITRGMIDGRRDTQTLFKLMKEHFPGFGNARIRLVAETIGIRETRRIIGLNYVTLHDALEGKCYPDCICRTTYNFDLPDPLKPSYDPMMGSGAHPNAERQYETIEVPYGVMIPDKVNNLLVTGRAVSVDHEVLGSLRVMGPCMLLGQAAGTSAALAFKESTTFPAVDGITLRKKLIEDGCLL